MEKGAGQDGHQGGQNEKRADPIMLRAYNDGHKGATAFFRNRPFLDTFFSVLESRCAGRIKILVHASSVGAEPCMFCIAQFRYASNGNKLGNLTAWFVFDLGLQGIFMLVLRFAARRASGWRTAQPFVCPTSVARQYFILPGTANFLRRLNPAVQSALTWGVRARD